jgi:hypothetical protein
MYVITVAGTDNSMRHIPVCLIIALLACPYLGAQEASPHAAKVSETIRQLRAIGVPKSDEFRLGPPDRVPDLLRQLNSELKALIVEDLNDSNRHSQANEQEILDQLTAAGWEEIPNHKWNAYGEIQQINFDWVNTNEPGILVVSTQLWIPCGSADPDSAIYVFRGSLRHWDLLLSTDSDFDAVGGDVESGMQYKMSPPDSHGQWFLVVAHLPPSCRGKSNTIRYKVLRPGANADKPEVLLERGEKINPDFDPPFRLDVQPYWFAVTEGKQRKLDGGPAVSIARYRVYDHSVQRIAPIALTPEDFLDQWIQMSWNDVIEWTKASPNDALQGWHSKLNNLASDSTDLESVHLCSGTVETDQVWLIELAVDQQFNPSIKDETLYIEVAKKDGIFIVDGIYNVHPSNCQGKTPLMPLTDLSLPHW